MKQINIFEKKETKNYIYNNDVARALKCEISLVTLLNYRAGSALFEALNYWDYQFNITKLVKLNFRGSLPQLESGDIWALAM